MSALRSSPCLSFVAQQLDEPADCLLAIHAEERRRRPRMKAESIAMAVFGVDEGAGKLTPVRVTDSSLMGLGVLSPVAVPLGSTYSLMHETGCAPRQIGSVVRCEAEGNYYRLGLKGRSVGPTR